MKTATLFVENIPKFIEFMDSIGQSEKLLGPGPGRSASASAPRERISAIDINNQLYGKKIVMTKVRDQDIIKELKTKGASLEETMTKDIFVLIVKSLDDISNKTKYAVSHNIPIMTPEQFKAKYL